MAIAGLLVGLWLIILVGQTSGACIWSDWSSWSSCNHPCGNAGTQSRRRGIARSSSCGGSGCSGPSSETRACNRLCYNSGTLRPEDCDCPDEYWGTCCDKRKSKTPPTNITVTHIHTPEFGLCYRYSRTRRIF